MKLIEFFDKIHKKRISVLGTEYEIICDIELKNADGTCDKSTKQIHLCKTLFGKPKEDEIKNKYYHIRKVLRHEVIHAFQYESGLQECSNWDTEQMTDYFAIQYPKMRSIFKELGIEW